jgi:VIT1/CCC1 family predicted Fe2+/Mn2+ transporter
MGDHARLVAGIHDSGQRAARMGGGRDDARPVARHRVATGRTLKARGSVASTPAQAAADVGAVITSIASMFLGGLVGAVLVLHADASLAIAAAAAILVVVAAAAALQSRTDRPLLGASQAP